MLTITNPNVIIILPDEWREASPVETRCPEAGRGCPDRPSLKVFVWAKSLGIVPKISLSKQGLLMSSRACRHSCRGFVLGLVRRWLYFYSYNFVALS